LTRIAKNSHKRAASIHTLVSHLQRWNEWKAGLGDADRYMDKTMQVLFFPGYL